MHLLVAQSHIEPFPYRWAHHGVVERRSRPGEQPRQGALVRIPMVRRGLQSRADPPTVIYLHRCGALDQARPLSGERFG